jgi:hypothetical protein
MSDPLEIRFEFEDLHITILGTFYKEVGFSGIATLAGDEDGFTVVMIELDGGPTLRRRGNLNMGLSSTSFEDSFAERICEVIENPKTDIGRLAESAWLNLVEDCCSHESQSAATADYQRSLAHG